MEDEGDDYDFVEWNQPVYPTAYQKLVFYFEFMGNPFVLPGRRIYFDTRQEALNAIDELPAYRVMVELKVGWIPI